MHPTLKAILIGSAIMVPVTLVINATQPSQGIVALTATASLSLCALIAAKLYLSELDRR